MYFRFPVRQIPKNSSASTMTTLIAFVDYSSFSRPIVAVRPRSEIKQFSQFSSKRMSFELMLPHMTCFSSSI